MAPKNQPKLKPMKVMNTQRKPMKVIKTKPMKVIRTQPNALGQTARKLAAKSMKGLRVPKASAPAQGASAEYEQLNSKFLALLNKPWKDMSEKEQNEVIKNLPNPGPTVYRHMHNSIKNQGSTVPDVFKKDF